MKVWEWLIGSSIYNDQEEEHLSRLLNGILPIIIVLGFFAEAGYITRHGFNILSTAITIAALLLLSLAYLFNRRGNFKTAIPVTLGTIILATFFNLWLRRHEANGPNIVFYLIVPILLGEFFLSLAGYVRVATLILAGLLSFLAILPDMIDIIIFMAIFSTMVGMAGYYRQKLEHARQEALVSIERRRAQKEARRANQLALLEEVGRQIVDSLDEMEIIGRTVKIIEDRFRYAEVAILLLVNDDTLEVAAIAGTENFGYPPGTQLKVGRGIIGHVAETRKPYTSGDVSHDPYYFSSAQRTGSALGVPMMDKEEPLGVIYLETTTLNEFNSDDVQTIQTLANQVATAIQKARFHARTKEHLQVMTTLQSISHVVASSLELNDILENVVALLKVSFGYAYISIYLLDGDILRLGAELGYPEDMIIHEIPINSGVAGKTVRSKQTQFIPDVSLEQSFLRADYEVKSEICVPLLNENNVLGILNVESNSDMPLNGNDVNLLNALAGLVAVAIDNARLHAEVKLMAMTDAVSGLANRRAFDQILETEVSRAHRYNHSLSLIILDLDSFKSYNDQWGHPAGDIRLKEIGYLLRDNVREPDVAARYGGEEFAVILPDTSKEGAVKLAERLREYAEAKAPERNRDGSPIAGYTLSLGVATFPEDAASLKELLLAADNAELTAKRLGKNRVHAANGHHKA